MLARPLPSVVDPRIVERFHCEMITFGWPRGAAAVRAYIGQPGVPAEQLCHGRPFGEVSAEQYERDGALILARPLTLKGCQVVLVAVSYSGGREIVGEPVGLQYPGLAASRTSSSRWKRHPGSMWSACCCTASRR